MGLPEVEDEEVGGGEHLFEQGGDLEGGVALVLGAPGLPEGEGQAEDSEGGARGGGGGRRTWLGRGDG